jgi:SET domain-containing protein
VVEFVYDRRKTNTCKLENLTTVAACQVAYYTLLMALTLHPKIEVRDSRIEGKSLFAKEPFKKGEQFRVTSGEHSWVMMTDREFQKYIKTVPTYDAVYLGNGKHRVSTVSREEDPSNYGNHSCNPNIASVGDEMIALRDIAAGEELTIDYAELSPKTWSMKCNCGAMNCTGIVKGRL